MQGWGKGVQLGPHRALGAVVHLSAVEESHVLDEDSGGPQDEGRKEMHMDVVSGTV